METKQDQFEELGDSFSGKKKKSGNRKLLRNILLFLFIGLSVLVYFRYFFVFGTGVKAGQLNTVMYKGYVFKTYEGKLIQAGYRTPKQGGVIQSYEFEFSISSKEDAEKLMVSGGREVELHYKQYFAAVPWRGNSAYVVDSIIDIKQP